MKVCLVGGGPSLLVEPCGEIIDSCDVVVRMKRCHAQLADPDHYGTKTDYVGGSLNIAAGLKDLPGKEVWLWVDSRHSKPEEAILAAKRYLDRPVWIDVSLCREWDQKYLARRTETPSHPQMRPSRYADHLGERHLSQGFKALLYACQRLKPDEILLAGYDNVMTGDFTWSVTRGPDWQMYPQHNWAVENEMLRDVEDTFGVKIGVLLPEGES